MSEPEKKPKPHSWRPWGDHPLIVGCAFTGGLFGILASIFGIITGAITLHEYFKNKPEKENYAITAPAQSPTIDRPPLPAVNMANSNTSLSNVNSFENAKPTNKYIEPEVSTKTPTVKSNSNGSTVKSNSNESLEEFLNKPYNPPDKQKESLEEFLKKPYIRPDK